MEPFEDQAEEQFHNKPWTWRFVEYLSDVEGVSLDEAARRSLSRAWERMDDPDVAVVIVTAFRRFEYDLSDPENDVAINRSRNERLEADIQSAGFGVIPLIGRWLSEETAEQPEEESFLATTPTHSDSEIREHVTTWLRKYDQDAAIYKPAGERDAYLLRRNGRMDRLGPWRLARLDQYYAQMTGGPIIDAGNDQRRWFKFEAAGYRYGRRLAHMATEFRFRNRQRGIPLQA